MLDSPGLSIHEAGGSDDDWDDVEYSNRAGYQDQEALLGEEEEGQLGAENGGGPAQTFSAGGHSEEVDGDSSDVEMVCW